MSAAVSAPGPSQDVRPVRRALVSVYDKTGLDDLVRGLHDAGVALVSTGGSAALIESLGLPVTKVEDLTGFPECLEGRVKTLHPQVHAGILADTRKPDHVAQLADLGVEAVRARGRQPLPVRGHRRVGRQPRRVRRADRHRRPLDGARGGQEPPERRRRHRPVARTATCWMPCAAAGSPSSSASAWRRRRSCTPPPTTCTSRRGWATPTPTAPTAPASRPGSARPGSAPTVLRYGENPHQHAALYTNGFQPQPALAQATQLHGKEMSYNNYVDADAAVRAAYDHGDQPTVADHQARQPVRHRRRRRRRRRPPQGPRVRPGVGLRRHHRHQPPGHRRDGRAPSPTSSPRSSSRPAFDADALEVLTAKKNIRLLECAAAGAPGRRGAADRRRPAHAAARRRGCRGDRRRRRRHRR